MRAATKLNAYRRVPIQPVHTQREFNTHALASHVISRIIYSVLTGARTSACVNSIFGHVRTVGRFNCSIAPSVRPSVRPDGSLPAPENPDQCFRHGHVDHPRGTSDRTSRPDVRVEQSVRRRPRTRPEEHRFLWFFSPTTFTTAISHVAYCLDAAPTNTRSWTRG